MKCTNCNGCVSRTKMVYENRLYVVCSLCKKVYLVSGSTRISEVEDPIIKNAVLSKIGVRLD